MVGAAQSASATSLMIHDPERTRDSLARITSAAAYCKDHGIVAHDAVDLVRDILALRTGEDPNSESEAEKYYAAMGAREKEALEDPNEFCAKIISDFCESGSEIRDLFIPRMKFGWAKAAAQWTPEKAHNTCSKNLYK
jgi:hypothetical protein